MTRFFTPQESQATIDELFQNRESWVLMVSPTSVGIREVWKGLWVVGNENKEKELLTRKKKKV